ncbi:squalene epoxidase-domain-containing protein [Fimicolochytrium jonesii]|uniref:squalene epoxidase-domain-containing protein n=1 Tax=Fimicolochytrium jonesii TaxID=1396493 RepID=UPI0022FF43CD|nr:squalene epoxidase-domain-containing protein [Fimicolochytrium jonesii]KAI8820836.1 squalene epoxidase-domain-containing protein [Fimicolochytrium jonesii]
MGKVCRIVNQPPLVGKTQYEIIIVGAGILGSALAATLGNDGRDVLVIERDWKEPDRIVGELLQPGGVRALERLGLEDCLEGIDAIPCNGYAVFYHGDEVRLPYPTDKLPNEGRSFHHGRFVGKLRERAKGADNVTALEASVTELISCPVTDKVLGVRYSYKDSEGTSLTANVYAPLTIVADGCFSRFRKHVNNTPVQSKSQFVGMILEDCPLPYPNHGHVILADPSPILLYQIGTHDTRILIDIPGKLPSSSTGALQTYLTTHIAPQLPATLRSAFLTALATQRTRTMPNSFLPSTANTTPGVLLLGDAMNMRHPLTGGGMTVALWDVVRVREEVLVKGEVGDLRVGEKEEEGKEEWEKRWEVERKVGRRVKSMHWKRKELSSVVNVLAQALYSLFSAGDDPHMKDLQRACFAYFKLGGTCVSTPVGLLAGLIPEPMTLVGHFFAVALYGVWLILTGRIDAPTTSSIAREGKEGEGAEVVDGAGGGGGGGEGRLVRPDSAKDLSGVRKRITPNSSSSDDVPSVTSAPHTPLPTLTKTAAHPTWPKTLLALPHNTARSVLAIYTACVVILPVLWSEVQP